MKTRVQIGIALCAAALLLVWGYEQLRWITIVDARVATNLIRISSRSAGWIQGVPVSDAQQVEKGCLLVQLDQAPIVAKLQEAAAELSAARARRKSLEVEYTLMEATVHAEIAARHAYERSVGSAAQVAKLEAEIRGREWRRVEALTEKKLVPDSVLDLRRAEFDQAKQRSLAEQARLAEANQLRAKAEAHALRSNQVALELEAMKYEIQQSEARHAQLQIELQNASLRSPVSGIIDRVFGRPGETVLPGQRLILMHDPADVWISANVKETYLRYVRVGTKARIEIDAYPGAELTGVVTHIDRAALDQFALIPTPSQSGSFTKITQRVNVRIDLEDPSEKDQLSPGMMVVVKLDRSELTDLADRNETSSTGR